MPWTLTAQKDIPTDKRVFFRPVLILILAVVKLSDDVKHCLTSFAANKETGNTFYAMAILFMSCIS